MAILLGIFEEGLIYAIMALGVYITYKILDFPDLSVDGTFPLGAALTAGLIVKGVSPVWALPLSFFAGVLAGCVTGVIHVKCKVRDLFSGIIVMTASSDISISIPISSAFAFSHLIVSIIDPPDFTMCFLFLMFLRYFFLQFP